MTIKEINKITERYSCEFRQHLKSMYNIGYSEGARAHAAMIELAREEKETIPIVPEVMTKTIIAELSQAADDRWIPITTRPLTEEEREDVLDGVEKVFTCELPADGEEVLVTIYEGKTVTTDTFWEDYDGGYFETYAEDVTAWRKLPEPYKKGGNV